MRNPLLRKASASSPSRLGYVSFVVSQTLSVLRTKCISQWLQTDLGSAQADLPVEKGSAGVLDIVNKADKAVNGQFFNIKVAGWENNPGLNQYDGANPPW